MSGSGILKDSALLIIDMQPDFMPGGALPVREGDDLVAPIGALVDAGRFGLAVATQDWHPPDHISFAGNHPGKRPFDEIDLYGHPQTLWPDHCIQGTSGAIIHVGLPLNRVSAIIRKGSDPMCDSYSAFRNNWNANGERPRTGLAGYLRECAIRSVFVCGLARDFCVRWSALDAAAEGLETIVLDDLTRPVFPDRRAETDAAFSAAGVRTMQVRELAPGAP